MKINKNINYSIPSYQDAIDLCSKGDGAFYESKSVVNGYNISVFNYRIAGYLDFHNPIKSRPELKGYEMRGLTFVFNSDGSLFNRYILLEKFFNINQVPNSMYSIVKNYKIKYVNNKEDGSIATFIKLPNGEIIGKSKLGFDNDQAIGINRVYKNNLNINRFVNYCIENDIVPIFEYVSPMNRIVLRYDSEELILLKLRNNITGKHLDIKDYLNEIGDIKIADFENDFDGDLDKLMELVDKQEDKEGCIVHSIDDNGNDFFFKLKTPWYFLRHGIMTNDVNRENIIVNHILNDVIDDFLSQIPEEEKEIHIRINKIINLVNVFIHEKIEDIKLSYKIFLDMNSDIKEYSLKYRKDPNFSYVMSLYKNKDIYEIAKSHVSDRSSKLLITREWLNEKDPTLFLK